MSSPPIGVANSISQNFQFDPLDTIEFAKQSNFEMLQIFLNQTLLAQSDVLKSVTAQQDQFQQIFYHAEGKFNTDFFTSEYKKQLYRFLATTKSPQYIIHFDENENIDKLIRIIEALDKEAPALYLENYFSRPGKINAEKNLKKYLGYSRCQAILATRFTRFWIFPAFFTKIWNLLAKKAWSGVTKSLIFLETGVFRCSCI